MVARIGPVTPSIDFFAASRGEMFGSLSRMRCVFSTTTIASSTTIPMTSTSPNIVSVFIEKPKSIIRKKVPMSETGITKVGMSAARQSCRKT